jgi:scyllo-inositol 2-dehydrogenase (NADP+)
MSFRAGLVGYGSGGRIFHAPLLHAAGIELAAIASRKSDLIARDFPSATAYASPQALFADTSLDLVIITTPSPTHAGLAIEALKAEHNVVVDKPFAGSVEDANAIIATAKKAGKLVSCFQNRRWDSDFLTLQDLMARGVLGEVHHVHSSFSFYKPEPPESWHNQSLDAVGIHFDLGTHLLDQLVQLFGMPDWVEGELITRRPASAVPDRLHARLGYAGVRAIAEADMFSPEHAPRFVVQGSKAGWRKDHMDGQEAQLKNGMKAHDTGYGVEAPEAYGTLTSYPGGVKTVERVPLLDGQHHTYYRLVREAVETGTEPPVTGEQVRDVLQIIEAVVQSSQTGTRITL